MTEFPDIKSKTKNGVFPVQHRNGSQQKTHTPPFSPESGNNTPAHESETIPCDTAAKNPSRFINIII